MSLVERAARSLKDSKKTEEPTQGRNNEQAEPGTGYIAPDQTEAGPVISDDVGDEDSVLEGALESQGYESQDSFESVELGAPDDAGALETGHLAALRTDDAAGSVWGSGIASSGAQGSAGAAGADASNQRSRRFSIDCGALGAEGYITPQARQGPIAEEIRLIKRRLLREMPSLHGAKPGPDAVDNVLMVTSAEPSEGKTFTSLNLALSFAVDEGFDVLLIDADVNNPALGRKLGLPEASPGLIDLLTDETLSMPDVLHRDPDLHISVMGVGSQVPSATELFGSALMQEFVAHVAQRYPDRVIIFDAPPVLASTEPMVLSQAMGHTLFVIGANQTQKDTVKSAIELLEPADNVRLVLNRMPAFTTERFGRSYSYGSA